MEYAKRKYDLTYTDLKEDFNKRIAAPAPGRYFNAGTAAATWLYEFETHQHELAEAERLNVMLPLLKWCVENNTMIEELENELDLYYEDYTEGRLDGILDPDEEEKILKDLIWSYKTYFKK